jgi:hypothetical protein
MKISAALALAALAGGILAAQESKPVPKDSIRVFVPGCSKGRIFTAAAPTEDHGGAPVPEGTHLRMNGKKDVMEEIKSHEGSRIEITGIVKRGQFSQQGVRIAPGGMSPGPGISQIMIDVEGWRRVEGPCPSR